MILADTSVWVEHLRKGSAALASLLQDGVVFGHPFVIGELALGHLRKRSSVLQSLQDLPQAIAASNEEALEFIEHHALTGAGIGYIDAHLLASVHLSSIKLWTHDQRLRKVAHRLGVAFAIN